MANAPCTLETFTAGDGYAWQYRHYPATGEPRGHVVAIHGIQSHGGWYGHSCAFLGTAGYTVDFLDRRGSGLNDAQRGDAPGFRRLLDDLAEFLRGARRAAPLPVILLAVSWGGKLAVTLQRRHPGLVDGLALLCPGFFPQVRPALGARLGIVWARLVAPDRKFAIPLNEPDLFTANVRWQEFIRTDPLALREATARLLVESVRLDGYLRWVPAYVRAPVLLMLAGRDRIIRNEPTRRFVDSFATPDRQVIEYPDAHHTLEFEPEPARFLGDLKGWLDRVCASAAAHN